MAKPRGDLGALVVPKAKAAAAIPHAVPEPPPSPPAPPPAPEHSPTAPTRASETARPVQDGGGAKALTVKLDGAAYRRLRRYCQDQEDVLGRRVTHQEVMVEALAVFLNQQAHK